MTAIPRRRTHDPRLTVVLPALNEADALPGALAGAPLEDADIRLLVVDNGSGDGTAEVARRLGADVVCEPRRGFGSACWTGALAAEGSDVVAFMDADATLTWADLAAVAAPVLRGEADLVLGRRVPSLRDRGAMSWHVAVANALLGRLSGRLAGVDVHDCSPLRAIRRDALMELGLVDRTYGWPLEMILRAGQQGLRVTEVDVSYRRRHGTSKVTGRPVATARAAIRMTVVLLQHRFGR